MIPDLFYELIDLASPLLVVMPESKPDIASRPASRAIPCLDLKSTGAIQFSRMGTRLDISSFVRGPLGYLFLRVGIMPLTQVRFVLRRYLCLFVGYFIDNFSCLVI